MKKNWTTKKRQENNKWQGPNQTFLYDFFNVCNKSVWSHTTDLNLEPREGLVEK